MAKIHGLLDVGKRGMMVSQSALQTTSHNIANKSTEGYTRQRVDIVTNAPTDEGNYRIGTGSNLGSISRINNSWLEKQIEREGSLLSFLESRADSMKRIESVVNEQSVQGLNNSMSQFFNSFRELANNPESSVARTVVRDNASGMINSFKDMNRQLDAVTSDLNKTIEFGMSEINSFASEISQLNQKIQDIELNKRASANDERDRRDLLLKKMSEKIDITYAEDKVTGMVNVTAGQTGVLVAGSSSSELMSVTGPDGKAKVIYELGKGGTRVDLTNQIKKGSLGGAINLRDGFVSEIKSNLEELSYNIANEVNKAHAEGFDRFNIQGVNFFNIPEDGQFQVSDLSLNNVIVQDVGRIAAAAKPDAPGDNTVANVIHSLQFKPIMSDGKFTFDDFYNGKVGQIAVETQQASRGFESQKNIVDQLKNTRESISGVSLDEEAAKMIEFQKSFEASARVIKMADEMFDTILNLKRI